MNVLNKKYLLITSIAIPIIWAIIFLATYLNVKSQLYNKYFVDLPNIWSPFYKQTYLSVGISGSLNVTDSGWKITSGKKEYSLLKTTTTAILGNKFSADDAENWLDLPASNLKTGDNVIMVAFYAPKKGAFIPHRIFVYKR